MDETPKRSTRDERVTRLLDAGELAADRDPKDKLYAHSVFAQTSLPYRNPGDDVRVWTRSNGQIGLRIEAGTAWNPDKGDFVQFGLPYGPKPRLLLAYLNAEALKQQSAEIEVERSLTAFVKAVRLDTKGRNINTVKDQLTRLSASTIRLGMTAGGEGVTIKSDIVSSFSLWWPKDERQRVMWPSAVRLSPSTSRACSVMPCHCIRTRWRRCQGPQWPWTFMPGWRSGCTGSSGASQPSFHGRRYRCSSADTMSGYGSSVRCSARPCGTCKASTEPLISSWTARA